MNKLLTLLLLSVFATGFNSAIYADEDIKTEKEPSPTTQADEEPECE